MDLEEELQNVPVGRLPGIEDDLDRLGVTRMVAGGRVVAGPAGIADGFSSVPHDRGLEPRSAYSTPFTP